MLHAGIGSSSKGDRRLGILSVSARWSGQRHSSNVASYVHLALSNCAETQAGAGRSGGRLLPRRAGRKGASASAQRGAAHEQVFMLPGSSQMLALAVRTVEGKPQAGGPGFTRRKVATVASRCGQRQDSVAPSGGREERQR